MNTKLRKL
jgi:very-long-chain enoyl-CoA reductase